MSEGEPSWENLSQRDGVAILDYVAASTGYRMDDIPVIALSLGGFVAIHAADQRAPQALVLESVFANGRSCTTTRPATASCGSPRA